MILALILIVIIMWIWYMHMIKPTCNIISLEDLFDPLLTNLKSGDLILFKSLNNLNSIYMCNYFTHIGMVIIDPILTNNQPYIFEASGTSTMKWKGRDDVSDNIKSIFLSPLKERMKRYLGYVYYKPLSHSITKEMHYKLLNFIFYAMKYMSYNYNILGGCIKKKFMNEKCGNKTNCGELIFLCLINMGLLNTKYWCKSIFHYLKWMCNIKNLTQGYNYNKTYEIKKTTI